MLQDQQNQITIKTILLGVAGVGKTTLILRWSEDKFYELYCTTGGVDFRIKHITIDKKEIKLQMWDTAGQERFRALPKSYYSQINGIFFVFDLTDQQSFHQLDKIYDEAIKEVKEQLIQANCILIGSKEDKIESREVSFDAAQAFADSKGMQYFETSAKSNKNCSEVLEKMAKYCFERNLTWKPISYKKLECKSEQQRCF